MSTPPDHRDRPARVARRRAPDSSGAPKSKRTSRRIREDAARLEAYRRNDECARGALRSGARRAGAGAASRERRAEQPRRSLRYAAAAGWLVLGRPRRLAPARPEAAEHASGDAVVGAARRGRARRVQPRSAAPGRSGGRSGGAPRRMAFQAARHAAQDPAAGRLGLRLGRRTASARRPGAGRPVHVPGRAGPAPDAVRPHQPGAAPGNGVPLRAGRQRAAVLLDRPRPRATRCRARSGKKTCCASRPPSTSSSIPDASARAARLRQPACRTVLGEVLRGLRRDAAAGAGGYPAPALLLLLLLLRCFFLRCFFLCFFLRCHHSLL